MHRFAIPAFIILAGVSAVYADDVYQKSKEKKTTGTVKQETGMGIVVTGVKELIPAEDIIDIEYEIEPVIVRTNTYRPAIVAEKDSLDPSKDAKRKANLESARRKYEDSLAKLGPGQEFARRHLVFKVGMLSLRQAQENGAPLAVAVAKLTEFKTKYPDSWQIGRCLRALAQLHVDAKQFKEADRIYKELITANVSADAKHQAEILAARAVLASGNHQAAEDALKSIINKHARDSKHAQRARIVQAECMIAAKKSPEAVKVIRQVIKETNDKSTKAAAYNVLGKSLYDAEQLKEARWEFLWVDMVYNQDKTEHARALYYLWKIFDRLGEADRAAECRETLLGERQFTASDWYRRAKVESAKTP